MAYDQSKIVKIFHVKKLCQQMKESFASKSDITALNNRITVLETQLNSLADSIDHAVTSLMEETRQER